MGSFNKMFMISPQQLEALAQKNRPRESIAERAQDVLEEKMQRVLNQPGPAYSKTMHYNDLLEKYLTLLRKDESRSREVVLKLPGVSSEKADEEAEGHMRVEEEEPPDIIAEEILENIGSRNRKNAAYILQKLRHSDLLKWNRSGEIIVRDKPIKGSHIFDLMKTLSNRRFHSGNVPHGWGVFLKTISDLNIPITTVTNTHAREQLRFKQVKTEGESDPLIRQSRRKRGKKSALSTSVLDLDYDATPSKSEGNMMHNMDIMHTPTPSEWRVSTPIPAKWLDFSRTK